MLYEDLKVGEMVQISGYGRESVSRRNYKIMVKFIYEIMIQ